MTKNQKFAAGMGTGAVLGMATVIGAGIILRKKGGKKIVKTTNKAVKAMSDIMDNIQDIIG